MRWKFILAACALAIVVAGIAFFWLYGAKMYRICPENYERIQLGMTQRQVEAIMGKPRREVTAKDPMDEIVHGGFRLGQAAPAEWWGRDGVITVLYDSEGKVSKKFFEELPFEPDPPNFWDYVLFRVK